MKIPTIIYSPKNAGIYMYIFIFMCIYMCVWFITLYVHMHTHTYLYTYTDTHTHASGCVCLRRQALSQVCQVLVPLLRNPTGVCPGEGRL